METKASTMNDSFISMKVNIRNIEMVIRLILSVCLFGVFFVDPSIQHKMLYVVPALYLFASAFMKWDPLYATLRIIRDDQVSNTTSIQMENRDVERATSENDVRAANDPHRSEDGMKEAG